MACSVPCMSGSYVTALSKKTIKESNQWQQHQQQSPSSPFLSQFQSSSVGDDGSFTSDDGGWSKGSPVKGSGWVRQSTINEWGSSGSFESQSNSGGGQTAESVGSFGVLESTSISDHECSSSTSNTTNTKAWQLMPQSQQSEPLQNFGAWPPDKQEESTSQSPVSSPSAWGSHDSTITMVVGNNWQIPTISQDVDTNRDNCCDTTPEWVDDNASYPMLSNGSNNSLTKERSLSHSELQSPLPDRNDQPCSTPFLETSRSEAGTPTLINSRSSGGATPTQDIGGRTSAGSTSSVNSIGSSSSYKSDGKGSRTYSNRVSSPRKPNRYDRSNSQSALSGNGSEKDCCYGSTGNLLYKMRKPRKSIADLDDGLGSLHNIPSGWGELPSPRFSDSDNGTELWGLPPDDHCHLINSRGQEKKTGVTIGAGWRDPKTQVVSTPPSLDWKSDESPGTIPPPMPTATTGWSCKDSVTSSSTETSSMWGTSLPSQSKDKTSPQFADSMRSVGDTTCKSPQEGFSKTKLDSELYDLDELNIGEASYQQNIKQRRLSKSGSNSSPGVICGTNSVPGFSSRETQHLPSLKLPPHTSGLGNLTQSQLVVLRQRLGQLQFQKQQVLQQLNQLSKSIGQSGAAMSPSFQQQQQTLTSKLNTITQLINQINQSMLSQLTNQQKELKSVHPKGSCSISHSHSTNSMQSADPTWNLPYGLHSLTLTSPVQSSVSQSSARSMSRLQQIISGSSSSDNLTGLSRDPMFKPITPSSMSIHSGGLQRPTSLSSPFSPPHSGSAIGFLGDANGQYPFSGPPSGAFGRSVSDIQEFKPGVPWQSKAQTTEPAQLYSKQSSVPSGNNQDPSIYNRPLGPPSNSNVQLVRSQSTSGSFYNPSYGTHKYNSTTSGWNPKSSMEGIGFDQPMNPQIPHGRCAYNSQPPTPSAEVSVFRPNGRTLAPPSSLYPSHQEFHYKRGRNVNKITGTSHSQQHTPSSQHGWVSFSDTANSSSSSAMSNAVWGTSPLNTPSDGIHQQQQNNHGWPQENRSSGIGAWTSSFNSPQSHRDTSEHFTPSSLTAGSGAWGQDALPSEHSMVSSDPTFTEWQAGKKAQLSISTKLPSSPPSCWLIIRNLNSQIDLKTIQEICKAYGILQTCVTIQPLECCLVGYQSADDCIRAKKSLGNHPNLGGAVVEFATKGDLKMILKYTQQADTEVEGSSWLSANSIASQLPPPSHDNVTSSPTCNSSGILPMSGWDNSDSSASSNPSSTKSFGRQSSNVTTPGSSMWSDSGFLSGLSSPWHSCLSTPGTTITSSIYSTTSPQEGVGSDRSDSASAYSNPAISTFLPNGLLQ